MNTFTIAFLTAYRPAGYLLFVLGMMLEGDAVLFTASFLSHLGFFELPFIVVLGLAGSLLGDSLWYFLGSKLSDKIPFVNKWLGKIALPVEEHLVNRPLHTIFIAKFTYGLHHILIARAGALKLPFRRFIRNDILATVPWLIIVVLIGFGSSASIGLLRSYFKSIRYALLIGLVLFFVAWHFVSGNLKKKI